MLVHHARAEYARWLLAARDLSPHTIRAYDGDVGAFCRHLAADALVTHIDRDSVVAFIEEQRTLGVSPTTIRRRVSGLRGFCRWLVSLELLDADPTMRVSVSAVRGRTLPRVVRAHDLDRLFRLLQEEAGVEDLFRLERLLDRPRESTTLLAVALMVATGVRVHEVVGIRCRDIDLPSRTVRILGKGRRERQVFLTNDWLHALTRVYLRTRAALGIQHAHLLFNDRGDVLSTSAMRTRLVQAARRAGATCRVTPHMLRHTAATQLIEANVDIRYIQRLLGHASLSTTEVYTHVSDEALRRVISDADVLGGLVVTR